MKNNRTTLDRRTFVSFGAAAIISLTAAPGIARASTGTLDEIKKRGYLLYGFNGERPYNYMDPDGNLVGSEIELARVIAKKMGIEEVQGVAMNFDSFIPSILAGRIDTCLPIFVKPDRCKKIQFSRPHLIEGQACIVEKGNPKGITGWDDLVKKDVRLGVIAGTTPNEIAKSAGVAEDKITRFPDTNTMAAGLSSGRIDAAVEASSTIRLMYDSLDHAKFERVSGWKKPTNYTGKIEFFAAYPFSLDATDLRNGFDVEISKMLAAGEIDQLASKYGFTTSDRPGPDSPTLDQICAG